MRANGFETPLSKDQVVSWILQPLLMSSFIAFVAKLLDRDKCLAILLPNAALIVIILMAWAVCESRNSANPISSVTSRFPPSCIRVPPKATRYCTICCKNSPGLDHHCTWLNTCIGESNYEAFYCLVVSATVQTLGQAVIGILMATLWFGEIEAQLSDEWQQPMRVLLWVHNAICLSLANSYFLLAGFHTYLLWIGSGTYDFILENGSDGLCARMLKCNCLRRSKKSKLSHVVNDDSSKAKKQGDAANSKQVNGGRRSKSPPPGSSDAADEAMRAAAAAAAAAEKKKLEMEQWKAEWLSKYGADDDEEDDKASDGATSSSASSAASAKVSSEASTGPPRSQSSANNKVSARRTSTYPAELITSKPLGESQINMSISINQSEDIFDEVDASGQAGDDAARVPGGPKTDL